MYKINGNDYLRRYNLPSEKYKTSEYSDREYQPYENNNFFLNQSSNNFQISSPRNYLNENYKRELDENDNRIYNLRKRFEESQNQFYTNSQNKNNIYNLQYEKFSDNNNNNPEEKIKRFNTYRGNNNSTEPMRSNNFQTYKNYNEKEEKFEQLKDFFIKIQNHLLNIKEDRNDYEKLDIQTLSSRISIIQNTILNDLESKDRQDSLKTKDNNKGHLRYGTVFENYNNGYGDLKEEEKLISKINRLNSKFEQKATLKNQSSNKDHNDDKSNYQETGKVVNNRGMSLTGNNFNEDASIKKMNSVKFISENEGDNFLDEDIIEIERPKYDPDNYTETSLIDIKMENSKKDKPNDKYFEGIKNNNITELLDLLNDKVSRMEKKQEIILKKTSLKIDNTFKEHENENEKGKENGKEKEKEKQTDKNINKSQKTNQNFVKTQNAKFEPKKSVLNKFKNKDISDII